MLNIYKKKKIVKIVLFLLLLFFIIGVYFYVKFTKLTVLIVTNDSTNDMSYHYKQLAKNKSKQDIEKIFPYIRVQYYNINFDKIDNKSYVEQQRKKLQKIFNNKSIVLIVFGSTSKLMEKFGDLLPTHIPIIADASSPYALKKFKGNKICTVSSIPYYSKGIYLEWIHKYLKTKGIMFLLKKNSPYSQAVYNSIQKNINVCKLDIDLFLKKQKDYIQKYRNFLWVIGIDNSNEIEDFIFLHLKDQNLSIVPIYPKFKYKQGKIKNTKIYSFMSVYYKKSIFEYDYINYFYRYKNLKDYNKLYYIDYIYRLYYSKAIVALKQLPHNIDFQEKLEILKLKFNHIINSNFFSTNIEKQIKENIFKTLYSEQLLIDPKTKYIYLFQKSLSTYSSQLSIYFNRVFEKQLKDKYLYQYNTNENGWKILPIQFRFVGDVKRIPVIFLEPIIRNIDIPNLKTDIAEVDLYVHMKYIYDKTCDYQLGKDILLLGDTQYTKYTEYALIDTRHINNVIHKLYRVKLFLPVHKYLKKFPFDTFYLTIEFIHNSMYPFLLYIEEKNRNNHIKKYDQFYVTQTNGTYADDIINLENSKPFYLKRIFYQIELQRFHTYSTLIKYFFLAVIIFIIGIYVSYYIMQTKGRKEISIISDTILGIISIYFIFSLLISIKELIYMDMVFYAMIAILSILLIFALKFIKK